MIQNAGTQSIVGNNATTIGTAGTAIRLFTLHVISTSGGGSIVSLRNGSTSGGTIWVTVTGTTSTGVTVNFGSHGILFPAGCFVSTDANSADVTATFNYAA